MLSGVWIWLAPVIFNVTVGAAILAFVSKLILQKSKASLDGQAERLKLQLAMDAERLKASLSRDSYVYQKVYDREQALYAEIWPTISALGMRISHGEFVVYDSDNQATQGENDAVSEQLIGKLNEAASKLDVVRPFIPKLIVKSIDELVGAATSTWIAWKFPALNNPEIFTKAKSADELMGLISNIEESLRLRTFAYDHDAVADLIKGTNASEKLN